MLDAFCRHYDKVKYPKCRPENDGDMLLFQYGVYDWGSGRWFEVRMVRQFIVESWRRHPDYARMEQLDLTLFYPPESGSEIERFALGATRRTASQTSPAV